MCDPYNAEVLYNREATMKKNGAVEEGVAISGRVFHLQWVRSNNFYNFEITQFLKRDILYSLQILLPGRRW